VGLQFRRLDDKMIEHQLTLILILLFANQNSNILMVLFNFLLTPLLCCMNER
jgi:hypothetical protein